MASTVLPTKMRALFLVKKVTDFNQADLASCFEVREVDVPTPEAGEVLVKVECSPINPSNLSILKGEYNNSANAPLPMALGSEGSGTVVAAGSGWLPWSLLGKRVGCGIFKNRQGLWAEYVCVTAITCITLPDDVSFDGGASCFVNPMTAVAFVEIAQARGVKALVHTAGASALGKMLIKHAKDAGVDVIAVVRRPEQVASLQAIGATYIVDTSNVEWKAQLAALTTQFGATLGFDAVAGALTGDVLDCMPNGSEIQVYGGLSDQACSDIHPRALIFHNKKVTGFWVTKYLDERGILGKIWMVRKVTQGLATTFATTIAKGYALEDAAQAMQDYTTTMSDNKVGFKPPMIRAASS
ncbi:Aste57867_8934 [Aphanomyces stellatus]|uniref:Aste57867_8934 protein n=1 Tax=Aphanomyces stellatus TaxID=120398 RepID=A0A485KLJ2_9STRA|nr:hypothetical protein As57867_008899 [Aphanomyces stellatus]VFT85818.1 Aste57867_8934 [Aphanomyces stellatus]